jgi:hypothetical protein
MNSLPLFRGLATLAAAGLLLGALTACPPATQPNRAAELVDPYMKSATEAARSDALTEALRQLGIEQSHGPAAPQRATESSVLILPDYEVKAVARASIRNRSTTLGEIAQWVGRFEPEHPATTAALQTAVRESIQNAKHQPNRDDSLIPLLVREVGLRQSPPYDLADAQVPDSVAIEPLQTLLIQTDLVANVRAAPQNAQPAGPAVLAWGGLTRKFVAGLGKFKAAAGGVVVGELIEKALHGSIIAWSITYRAYQERLETHYGHGIGKPGKMIRFEIQVIMQDEFPIEEIPVLGKVPRPGAVSGVQVSWPDLDQLRAHGDVIITQNSTVTDQHGLAWFDFQPKDEALPGAGMIVVETGIVSPRVWIQKSTVGSYSPGVLIDALSPTTPIIRWFVGRHALGYSIDFDPVQWAQPVRPGDHSGTGVYVHTERWRVEACGDEPEGATWKLSWDVTRDAIPDNPAYRLAERAVGTRTVALSPGAPLEYVDRLEGSQFSWAPDDEYEFLARRHLGMRLRIELSSTEPVTARLILTPEAGGYGYVHGERSAVARVKPNADCLSPK